MKDKSRSKMSGTLTSCLSISLNILQYFNHFPFKFVSVDRGHGKGI